jgi:hypothetical protein
MRVDLEKTSHAPTGETRREKHGVFDGDYWRQSSDEHRRGFVEGYLECREQVVSQPAKFSRACDKYVQQVSNWYGVDVEDPAAINERRVTAKIATVLFTLRDPDARTAPH